MDKNTLTILDVGHGNSAILEDNKGIIVIDTGPGSALLEFLTNNNIKNIDVILLSHADADHIGGLLNILANGITVGMIRLNTDSLKDSAIWDDLLKVLDDYDRSGRLDFDVSLVSNKKENYDQGDVNISILGPSKYLASKGPGSNDKQGNKITSNSISAVIKLSIDDKPIALFTGDLDEIGLSDIISNDIELSSPILVYPHHGGRPLTKDEMSFTNKICELVNPSLVIFSIGRGKYGTPRPNIVKAVKTYNPEIHVACTQLSENCCEKLPGKLPSHLADVFSCGKETNKCCSGSITVDLNDIKNITPSLDAHLDFIKNYVSNALCQ